MGECVGPDGVEVAMLREPFEVAAGGKNEARFTALLALQNFARAQPAGTGAFAFDYLRLPIARRAARDEEQGVEPPHGVEFRHPSGERRQRRRVEPSSGLFEHIAEVFAASECRLQLEAMLRAGR